MKSTAAAQAAWCAVTTTDPADLDRDAIAQLLDAITTVRAMCDAAEVLAVRRTRELAAAGTSEPAENLLTDKTGRSSKGARAATKRELACEAMPALEAGLQNGTVSAGHIDAAAAAHAKLDDTVAEQFAAHDADLAARSQQLGVDAFERECNDLARFLTSLHDPNAEADELERQRAASSVKRWVDKVTGMHHTLISLDPLRDSKMWKVINHQVGREKQRRRADGEPPLPYTALQAAAVVATIIGPQAPSAGSPQVPPSAPSSPNDASAAASGHAATPASSGVAPSAETGAAAEAAAPTSEGAVATAEAGAAAPAPSPGSATKAPAAPTPEAVPEDEPVASTPTDHSTDGSCNCSTKAKVIRLPEISILCDYNTLVTGIRAAGGICETDDGTPLPPEIVRLLACDANVTPVMINTEGEVLAQGRAARTATPAQRNTLAAMHRTCAFPGCSVGFSDTRMHHVRWWWKHHGPTNIDNLLPLCEKHHHLVHEGGWGLALRPDRTATWTRPDGTVHHTGTTLDRRPRDVPQQE